LQTDLLRHLCLLQSKPWCACSLPACAFCLPKRDGQTELTWTVDIKKVRKRFEPANLVLTWAGVGRQS